MVAPGDGQSDAAGAEDVEDGNAHLGPHSRHADEHFKAAALFLALKSEKAYVVFGDIHIGIQGTLAAHTGQRPRHR